MIYRKDPGDKKLKQGDAYNGLQDAAPADPYAKSERDAGTLGVAKSGGGPEDGWQNLQDYVALNQKQGAGMANKVTTATKAKAETAQGDVDKAWSDFQQKAGQTFTNADSLRNNPGGMTSAQVQGMTQQTYSGPNSLTQINGGLGAEVDAAQGKVNQLATADGQDSSLRDAYGKSGKYNAVQSGLDAFLAGQNDDGAWDQLVQKYGGGKLQDSYTKAVGQSQDLALKKQGEAKAASDDWKTMLPGVQSSEKAASAYDYANEPKHQAALKADMEDRKMQSETGGRIQTRRQIFESGAIPGYASFEDWAYAGFPGY
jgi:hypothetical protein